MALIQAAEIKASMADANENTAGYERESARREAADLKHRLGILFHEANAGFEEDWDLRFQREAVRAYLIELLSSWKLSSREKDPILKHLRTLELVSSFPFQLTSLARVLIYNHFVILSWVEDRSPYWAPSD